MRRIISTRYSSGAFNTALLILRLGLGILIMHHGYQKLTGFSEIRPHFMNFMGLGQTVSLSLVVFAEFFCAIFLMIGLFTRFACIPLIVVMSVALFQAHQGNIYGKGEVDTLYLIGFVAILLTGPGRVSVDSLISK